MPPAHQAVNQQAGGGLFGPDGVAVALAVATLDGSGSGLVGVAVGISWSARQHKHRRLCCVKVVQVLFSHKQQITIGLAAVVTTPTTLKAPRSEVTQRGRVNQPRQPVSTPFLLCDLTEKSHDSPEVPVPGGRWSETGLLWLGGPWLWTLNQRVQTCGVAAAARRSRTRDDCAFASCREGSRRCQKTDVHEADAWIIHSLPSGGFCGANTIFPLLKSHD